MMKKALFLFFVILIVFNILNVIDKITTYYGIKQGFIELNQRSLVLIDSFGLLFTRFLFVFVGIISSIALYLGISKLSNKIKHIEQISVIPLIFLIGIYINAINNNLRLII